VQIETTRFGPIDIDAEKLLHFPTGLLGFPEVQNYVIFDHTEEGPFKWLQAVEDPALAFLIVDPCVFVPDYKLEVQETELHELGIHDANQTLVFVLVTVRPGTPPHITANLQGPVVVNLASCWAKQLVVVHGAYHTQHPLFATSAHAGRA
jgi:flagellar assembly factor FliW